jgi:hypothetical protein
MRGILRTRTTLMRTSETPINGADRPVGGIIPSIYMSHNGAANDTNAPEQATRLFRVSVEVAFVNGGCMGLLLIKVHAINDDVRRQVTPRA